MTEDSWAKKDGETEESWEMGLRDNEWVIRDEFLARVFLAGLVHYVKSTAKGKVTWKSKVSFLRGEKEANGRKAFLRVLERSNFPLKHELAALFDDKVRKKVVVLFSDNPGDNPNPNDIAVINEQCRLELGYRSKNIHKEVQDSDIWQFMNPPDGKRPPVKKAMNFFGLSRQAIYDAEKREASKQLDSPEA